MLGVHVCIPTHALVLQHERVINHTWAGDTHVSQHCSGPCHSLANCHSQQSSQSSPKPKAVQVSPHGHPSHLLTHLPLFSIPEIPFFHYSYTKPPCSPSLNRAAHCASNTVTLHTRPPFLCSSHTRMQLPPPPPPTGDTGPSAICALSEPSFKWKSFLK